MPGGGEGAQHRATDETHPDHRDVHASDCRTPRAVAARVPVGDAVRVSRAGSAESAYCPDTVIGVIFRDKHRRLLSGPSPPPRFCWSPGSPALAAVVSATPDPLPTFNGTVLATAYAGDTLYVGGDFTSVTAGGQTVARSRLAAINAPHRRAARSGRPPRTATVRAIAVSGPRGLRRRRVRRDRRRPPRRHSPASTPAPARCTTRSSSR